MTDKAAEVKPEERIAQLEEEKRELARLYDKAFDYLLARANKLANGTGVIIDNPNPTEYKVSYHPFTTFSSRVEALEFAEKLAEVVTRELGDG